MPLHHYTCRECDHDFEMLVDRGEEPACPECASTKLEKQLPRIGIPQVKAGGAASSCGDLSLPPCGAAGCRRTGRA